MRGAGPERCAGLATGHRDVTSATYARISATLALMPHVRVLFALRQATAEPEYRRAMRILIATDAWRPQINGVVKTLECTIVELERRGHAVRVISPDMFWTMPMPSYPEIRLAFARKSRLRAILRDFNPDHVHIATEGPIGWAMRGVCLKAGRRFSTCYHTRFPEYVSERLPIPVRWSYAMLRRFHGAGDGVMVATDTIEQGLGSRGFRNIVRWGRGVDLEGFTPSARGISGNRRPVFLYVGRLAPEKNIDAFLSLDLPGTKLVVGDGPSKLALKVRFPDAVFLGAKTHAELPAIYASADAFVFPSLTDTFGLVLVEAMACGLPVAAFPAPGPLDVIGRSGAGVISTDLRAAALQALSIDRRTARRHAENFSWARATDQFLANVHQIEGRDAETEQRLAAAE
jgi:glycosyltransferase involved in cell wall biosynthesis